MSSHRRTTPKMNQPRNDDGFSLLELSAALFVMTVGVSGMMYGFYTGLEKTRAIQETTIAVRAIQNEVEFLRAVPFEALEAGDRDGFLSQTPESARLVNAERRVSVRNAHELGPALKEVTVTLAWTGEHGRRISKSLTTLFARH